MLLDQCTFFVYVCMDLMCVFVQLYSIVLLSVSCVCTCMGSIVLQCVPVGAHLGILVGLIPPSCARARPIN